MKKLVSFIAMLVVSLMLVTPAYAAELNSAEQKVLGEFKEELDYWHANTNFDEDHVNQYYGEAESALLAVDLSEEACAEFSDVIKQVHEVFVQANASNRHELWLQYTTIAKIINDVGAKYYKLHVTVNPSDKYAKVTWEINGKTSTAATTGKTVKQTGYGLGQTIAVSGASFAVLGGAYAVAHKKQLFVA